MKLKADKATEFCRNPNPNFNIVFLSAEDAGVAIDAAEQLVISWRNNQKEEFEETRLHEEEVKRDPALLGDALTARPLFGGRHLVRLNLSNDGLAKPIDALLTSLSSQQVAIDSFLIVIAENLSAKSRTRAAFEKSKLVACLEINSDSEENLTQLAIAHFEKSQVAIDADALEVFIHELPGDRRLANAEMEKLSLYAFDLMRPVNVHDVELVSATERKLGAEDAADAALAGQVKLTISATDRFLDAGGSPISGLRTLHFRLIRVLDALSGEKFLRPRVSPDEKSMFNNMLKSWNAARISRALTMLYAAELSCKQAGAPVEAIFKTVMDRISRRTV